MRIYIIGNDGITLCREAPATLIDDEVAVASKEQLHAAPLSGKRLLALWNALPGVEKRRKVGDRKALIDQLWSAIEALPEPEPPSDAKRRRSNWLVPAGGSRLSRTEAPLLQTVEQINAEHGADAAIGILADSPMSRVPVK